MRRKEEEAVQRTARAMKTAAPICVAAVLS
jgi:hypothetical protein